MTIVPLVPDNNAALSEELPDLKLRHYHRLQGQPAAIEPIQEVTQSLSPADYILTFSHPWSVIWCYFLLAPHIWSILTLGSLRHCLLPTRSKGYHCVRGSTRGQPSRSTYILLDVEHSGA